MEMKLGRLAPGSGMVYAHVVRAGTFRGQPG